jgi:microcystin-dependent protein
MPWNGAAPSKTFGRTDGTRTGSSTWQQADAASVDIISTDHDTHDQDVADGINAALCKDGGNTATANIPMGGFTFTNIAAATARTMPARMSDVQDGKATYYPTVGGTADAITITGASTAITAYAAGQTFQFIAAATNTSTATINVDSVGAKSITGAAAATLQAGQIASGAIVTITYDGTQFQLTNTSPVAVAVGTIMAWPTSTVPNGWLECYGQAISRTTYSALFAAISTVYGVGDGSTTFNLPDMRGRAIAGEDDMGGSSANRLTGLTDGVNGDTLGAVGGLESTTIGTANLPSGNLSHSLSVSTTITNGTTVFRGSFNSVNVNQTSPTGTAIGSSGAAAETLSLGSGTVSGTVALGGSGTAINNLPPTIILKWIILAIPASTLSVYTPANGSELTLASGGIINWDGGDVTITHSANTLTMDGGALIFNEAGGNFDMRFEGDTLSSLFFLDASADSIGIGTTSPDRQLHVVYTDTATNANAAALRITHSTSGTATTGLGVGIEWEIENASGTDVVAAAMNALWTDATNASEDAKLQWALVVAGAGTAKLEMTSTNLYPFANDGLALGAATLAFADLFLASGAVVNFNNGNYTLTHSAGSLAANGTFSTTGILTSRSGTATPAAASAVAGVTMGSAAVGIYWGTGDPNTALTAARGSLYCRTDGGAGTTLYTNTDGVTAWSAV